MRPPDHAFIALNIHVLDPLASTPEMFKVDAAQVGGDGSVLRFSSYIHTDRPPSYRMKLLADAGAADLLAAPELSTVRQRLREFIGQSAVFVLDEPAAFAGSLLLGETSRALIILDELIELIHPELGRAVISRYAALLHIDGELGLDLSRPEDLVLAVYSRIWRDVLALDPRVLLEIEQHLEATSWPLRFVFATAAGTVQRLAPRTDVVADLPEATGQKPSSGTIPSGTRGESDSAGIVETLAKATRSRGAGYDQRPQQLEMAEAIASALADDCHLLVEAGTGTGKSLAYLLPAAGLAMRDGERVLVSTHTLSLQEQLLEKDLPAVRALLADFGPEDLRLEAGRFRYASLKGRRNYLCLQRFSALRRTPILSEAEARFVVRILIWLSAGGGDRAGLRLSPEEESIWTRVSADGATCFAAASPFVRNGTCQLVQARRKAEDAHLVVVNHALLLSDLAAERHILPMYDRLIVDEAHNLEDIATDQFGFHAGLGEVNGLLDAVTARGREAGGGLLSEVRAATLNGWAEGERAFLESVLSDLVARVDRARHHAPEAFRVLGVFALQQDDSETDYDRRTLITRGTRSQPDWDQVELAWENLRLALQQVEEGLERLGLALADRATDAVADRDGLLGAISGHALALRLVREGLESVLNRYDEQRVAWLTVSRSSGSVTVASAPLDVGDLLRSYLFGRKSSVILTSATLSTGGSFNYVRSRLGVEEARELALGSPFDYERAALLLLPTDMPEPARREYQAAVENAVVELCAASHGRALILFTSYSALRSTYRAIKGRLSASGLRVLGQGIDGSPPELLNALRIDHQTVICGTASFWEGVDVVGEALSLLVIAKLPFSVPSDPVFSARAQLFDDPFRDYALPQAILRFKQGFGRLIRHRDDRGVVAVLDRRIRSKNYGRTFVRSLPACTIVEASIGVSADRTAEWLGSDQ